MTSVPIAASDRTWLNMDQPTNLMVINGLLWFDEEPDWDAVRGIVQERLVQRYAVLHRRPVLTGRRWTWQDDPDFDLDFHVRRVTLPEPGDREALEKHVSARASQPIDRDHPLWEMDLISGFNRPGGHQGAAVLARFHHALADGIRIVQLVMGLCDVTEGATPPVVGRPESTRSPIARVAGTSRQVVGDVASFTGELIASTPALVPRAARAALAAATLNSQTLHEGFGLLARPTRVTDAITGLAAEDNRTVNTGRSAARLALWGHDSRLVADRAPGIAKRVSWIEGLDLKRVKAIGRAHGATVNDVLLSAVALGLTRYLTQRGRSGIEEASFFVPVSLKPVDASLPAELGNHFTMVMFPMPLGITDIGRLLPEVHARMTRIKNSSEATLVYGVQHAVAETPAAVSERITALFADKTVGVLTNVPGPRVPIALAGTTVVGILGWVPKASDQNLGLCILSYAGSVNIGVSADASIMPDPDRLAALIVEAVDDMNDHIQQR